MDLNSCEREKAMSIIPAIDVLSFGIHPA